MVDNIMKESESKIIDPKALGIAWNSLPSGNSVSYKLSFKKGLPQVPEAKPAAETTGESLAA